MIDPMQLLNIVKDAKEKYPTADNDFLIVVVRNSFWFQLGIRMDKRSIRQVLEYYY